MCTRSMKSYFCKNKLNQSKRALKPLKKIKRLLVKNYNTNFLFQLFQMFLASNKKSILHLDNMLTRTCSHNAGRLSFTNIRGLCLNFIEYESYSESNSPDILPLLETNLDEPIASGNFSVRGYLPFIRRDFVPHIHSLEVCLKDFLLHRTYLQKTLQILFYVLARFIECLYAQFLILFHLTEEIFSIIPPANVFVFG